MTIYNKLCIRDFRYNYYLYYFQKQGPKWDHTLGLGIALYKHLYIVVVVEVAQLQVTELFCHVGIYCFSPLVLVIPPCILRFEVGGLAQSYYRRRLPTLDELCE